MAKRRQSDSLSVGTERFVEHLALERRSSPHTVAAYRRDLTQLAAYLSAARGRPARVGDVTKLTLRSWLGELAKTRSARTVARKLSAVRALFRYLELRGDIRSNPADQLASPKVSKKLPTFLSASAADEVIAAPGALGRARRVERLRDTAALELLYGSGLRVSELVGLGVSSVSLDEGSVRVLGKGDKERVVPLGEPARKALLAYLAERNSLRHPKTGHIDDDALLLSRRGTRLGVRWIQKLVQRYGAHGAGRADLHPHALRHSCATHMLEGGADLRVIQELLGHASLATTQQYTHVSVEQLLRVYDDAHPLARRRKKRTDGE